MNRSTIRIGTRGSKLALIQAEMVKAALQEKCDYPAELIVIQSKGDKNQDSPLKELGAGSFTNELNRQILEGKIDMAVHSCKDLPSTLEEGLDVLSVLERGAWLDVFISANHTENLPDASEDAIIGTGSVRRKAQWAYRFPNHRFAPLRGNIENRIEKLYRSDWAGIIMAEAALVRLKIDIPCVKLQEELPATCQGTIAIVALLDTPFHDQLKSVNHLPTFMATRVEREFIRTLGIDCDTPLGVLAEIRKGIMKIRADLFSADGRDKISFEDQWPIDSMNNRAVQCAEDFLEAGAENYLAVK